MWLELDADALRSDSRWEGAEWLETHGNGAYASSSICGANTRRYHGLLVASTAKRAERWVLLSKLDESLEIGGKRFELGTNFYPGSSSVGDCKYSSTIHPLGFQYIEKFTRDLFPQWQIALPNAEVSRTVCAVHGENTTVIYYQVRSQSGPMKLILNPLVAGRQYHGLVKANDAIARSAEFRRGVLEIAPYAGVPRFSVYAPKSSYRQRACWYYNFEYPRERERGFDYREDLFSYGELVVSLRDGESIGIVVSADSFEPRDALALMEKERDRRHALIEAVQPANECGRALVLASDQFIVGSGEDRSIIAGYPWFTEWGRDAMIALPGLCISQRRYEDARAILNRFLRARQRGLVPNRFADSGGAAEFNTADASLWAFVAVFEYWRATRDEKVVREEFLPALADILQWHERGTDFDIREDASGLLSAGTPATQLTWMDARVDGVPVTPRWGYAVELNALWCNALYIMAELHAVCGDVSLAPQLFARAEKSKRAFGRAFWYKEGRYLYDVLSADFKDSSIRPNQILALSLPFPLLAEAKARQVLSVVEEHLATPFGLRTLSPTFPGYCPSYEGDPRLRDAAYHQGTVWPWLMGHFLSALARYGGVRGRARVQRYLEAWVPALAEYGVGSIAEIFDGDPPHRPRGCPYQAWSVSEVLRALMGQGGGGE